MGGSERHPAEVQGAGSGADRVAGLPDVTHANADQRPSGFTAESSGQTGGEVGVWGDRRLEPASSGACVHSFWWSRCIGKEKAQRPGHGPGVPEAISKRQPVEEVGEAWSSQEGRK